MPCCIPRVKVGAILLLSRSEALGRHQSMIARTLSGGELGIILRGSSACLILWFQLNVSEESTVQEVRLADLYVQSCGKALDLRRIIFLHIVLTRLVVELF